MAIKTARGQTLIEVIFVIALITVALAAFVFTATRSVRSSSSTSSQSLATQYAQEGMEMVRTLRDRNWARFQSYGGSTRCPSANTNDEWAAWPHATCTVNLIYDRKATFDWTADKMNVDVAVTWNDGSGTHTTSLKSFFVRL